jgi:hypothetical protein
MQELSNFLEGNVDEDFKRELRSHLIRCQHCQVVVDTTRKTIELYCDGELFPLPGPVRERLHDVLRKKCQQKST